MDTNCRKRLHRWIKRFSLSDDIYTDRHDSSDDLYSIEKGYFYQHKEPKIAFIAYELNVPTYKKGEAKRLAGKFYNKVRRK